MHKSDGICIARLNLTPALSFNESAANRGLKPQVGGAMKKKSLAYYFVCLDCGGIHWYLPFPTSTCPYCEKTYQSHKRLATPKYGTGIAKQMPFGKFLKEVNKLADPSERARAREKYYYLEYRLEVSRTNDTSVELPF